MGKIIATANFELPQLKFKLNSPTGLELCKRCHSSTHPDSVLKLMPGI
jgi:hypothetical protein